MHDVCDQDAIIYGSVCSASHDFLQMLIQLPQNKTPHYQKNRPTGENGRATNLRADAEGSSATLGVFT